MGRKPCSSSPNDLTSMPMPGWPCRRLRPRSKEAGRRAKQMGRVLRAAGCFDLTYVKATSKCKHFL